MGFVDFISNILTSLDIFGQGFSMRIQKQEKTTTVVGGLLTVVMICTLGGLFIVNSRDVYEHKNPNISVEQKITQTYPNITLDSNSFPFAFGIAGDTSVGYYNPRYFNYVLTFKYGMTAGNLVEYDVDFKNCNYENFPKISQAAFDGVALGSFLCVPSQNLSISGSWSYSYISQVNVKVGFCKNTTKNNNNCAPRQEVVDYINSQDGPYFYYIYQNTNVNPTNYLDPISYSLTVFYKIIELGVYKNIEMYLRPQTLQSDDGFLFSTNNILDSIGYDYNLQDQGKISDTEILAELNIHPSPNIFIYHRVYTRIQTVIAGVGGLANIITMIFLLLAKVFSITKRDELLLNQIFDFNFKVNPKPLASTEKNKSANGNFLNVMISQSENSPNKNYNFPENENNTRNKSFNFYARKRNNNPGPYYPRINSKNEKLKDYREIELNVRKDLTQDQIIDHSNCGNVDNTQNIKQVDRSKSIKKAEEVMSKMESRTKQERIHFSFCEILISNILCCKSWLSNSLNTKKKLYEKGNSILENYLDLPKQISILEEFEKFKIVLLNPKQLALFKFISKELISMNDEDLKNHKMTYFKMMEKDKMGLANLIVDDIDNLKKANLKDDVDKKLYNLLNEEFKF